MKGELLRSIEYGKRDIVHIKERQTKSTKDIKQLNKAIAILKKGLK